MIASSLSIEEYYFYCLFSIMVAKKQLKIVNLDSFKKMKNKNLKKLGKISYINI
jgi:hypothetical protein